MEDLVKTLESEELRLTNHLKQWSEKLSRLGLKPGEKVKIDLPQRCSLIFTQRECGKIPHHWFTIGDGYEFKALTPSHRSHPQFYTAIQKIPELQKEIVKMLEGLLSETRKSSDFLESLEKTS